MADTGTFCSTEDVQMKVGANASTTSNTEDYINEYVDQAESYINVLTRHNWTDEFDELNGDVKAVLKEAASNLAAIYVINYDLGSISAVTSRAEAEDRLLILWARLQELIELLKLKASTDFIEKA